MNFVTSWLDSFAGPTLMFVAKFATVCSGASSLTVNVLLASVKLGESLTAVTVMPTVVFADCTPPVPVLPLSLMPTDSVSLPLKFKLGR